MAGGEHVPIVIGLLMIVIIGTGVIALALFPPRARIEYARANSSPRGMPTALPAREIISHRAESFPARWRRGSKV